MQSARALVHAYESAQHAHSIIIWCTQAYSTSHRTCTGCNGMRREGKREEGGIKE